LYRIARNSDSPIIKIFLPLVICVLLAASLARSATLAVPKDKPTIQAAITDATPGDIIVVAPGTYFETIDFLGKAITLRSSGGPLSTIIDGMGAGSVVQCITGEGADTVLEGFTITGGKADIGGGMRNVGSSPSVIGSIFTANHADDRGGGMYNRQGNPTVMNSTFNGNTAGAMGGGMFNIMASPMITNSWFTQNNSNKGAGMRNYLNSHPTVTNSTFSYNQAGEEGGGMDNRKNSNPVVTGSVFKGNTAGSGGGGMHNYVGRALATANPLIINCLFFGNSAPTGAGVRNNDSHPTFLNSTIVYNIGSGISSRNGSEATLLNTLVWGNTEGSIVGASAGLSKVDYSNIDGDFDGEGNLNVDPVFVSVAGADGDLATLDDNDYHLTSGSPLVNAGINDLALPTTDLDGKPRIVDHTVDMGAYEFDNACEVGAGTDHDVDGYTTCQGDCNDNDASIHPLAQEICDSIDNNCNAAIDEGFDGDSDGYSSCSRDCNDGDASISPAATELCTDSIDNNCDGFVDSNDTQCTSGGGDSIHIGDLDYESAKLPKGIWQTVTTVSVHTASHVPVEDALVTGTFHQGSATVDPISCTTDSQGICPIKSGPLPDKKGSALFTVDNLSHGSYDPDLSQSHDPDGDSDGSAISISK
jgi:hypothetical protein